MQIASAKDWLLDLVFPKFCLGCGSEGTFLCTDCRGGVVFGAPTCPVCSKRNFDGVLSPTCEEKSGLRRFLAPFSYRDLRIRELIHAYKYEGVRELKSFFVDEIVRFLNFYGVRSMPRNVLVPIPLHPSRLRERGFNQSELLARELGTRFGLEVACALARTRATEQQIEMPDYRKRRENVAAAFCVIDPAAIAGRTVVLIDDVSTSGATLAEAARTVRAAGARTVWAIAIAKG